MAAERILTVSHEEVVTRWPAFCAGIRDGDLTYVAIGWRYLSSTTGSRFARTRETLAGRIGAIIYDTCRLATMSWVRYCRVFCCLLLVLSCSPPVLGATGGAPASNAGGDATFHTVVTVERVGDIVEITFAYTVPSSISRVELRSGAFDDPDVTIVEARPLERTAATTYEWDGGVDPALVLRLPITAPPLDGTEYAAGTDEWALVTLPTPSARFRYRGDAPRRTSSATVEGSGSGYATSAVAYLGEVDRVSSATTPGTATVVAPANTVDRERLGDVADLYAAARRDFPIGLASDETVVFVLPTSKLAWGPGGFVMRQTVVLRPQALDIESVENTPAHEYVHTRMGVFRGSSNWLREGTAQYYGALLSLNAGIGTFEEFRTAMRAPSYQESGIVLTDRSTWDGRNADYDKGAHVLATLDAEIRRRTDGTKTLRDVFALRFSDRYDRFNTYDGFRQAVIDVTEDPSIGRWLDRYVATDTVPSIPADPSLYVMDSDSDSDGDSLLDGREGDLGTNPFAADSDGDAVRDDAELDDGTVPTVADTDGDGLDDGMERERGTDPRTTDSDGDGVADGADAFPLDESRTTATLAKPSQTAFGQDVTDTGSDWSGQQANDGHARQTSLSFETLLLTYGLPSGPVLLVGGLSISLVLAFVVRALT